MGEQTVLVVEHQADAPAGWLGEGLEEAGCRLDVLRPYAGDRLPDPQAVAGVDGLVVLGGSMAAWDDTVAPWLPGTRTLVRAAEEHGVPVLGVCLGHQLAARALGGEVAPNPAGSTVAVLPVCWAEDAHDDPLFGGLRDVGAAVHWNNDVVTTLPVGGRTMAAGPDGAVQAARLGRHVWGVQFHPEVGPEIAKLWVDEEGAPFTAAGHDLERYVGEVRRHAAELSAGCRRLAQAFCRVMAGER